MASQWCSWIWTLDLVDSKTLEVEHTTCAFPSALHGLIKHTHTHTRQLLSACVPRIALISPNSILYRYSGVRIFKCVAFYEISNHLSLGCWWHGVEALTLGFLISSLPSIFDNSLPHPLPTCYGTLCSSYGVDMTWVNKI